MWIQGIYPFMRSIHLSGSIRVGLSSYWDGLFIIRFMWLCKWLFLQGLISNSLGHVNVIYMDVLFGERM